MTHVTPGPLVLGDTRNEYNDGYAWVVPVWADVSPNCIYAEARHENRTEARKRAALIVHAVNTLELVRVIIPAIKQTIERVRCLEAGQAITTEADNLLADIQDNLNIVLTNMDGKQ